MLRHERGAREEPQGGGAGRPHPPPRLRDRLRARISPATRFAGLPANVVVVARRAEETAAFVAGDVGAIGCVQADARLDRVRAFVKIQDGCSFSCCVLRHPARARRVAQPRAPTPCSARSAGASSRATARSCSPGSTSAASATARPATTCRGSCARRGATPGLERLRLCSIEINHVSDELVAALRETPTVAKHLHVPLQSGDDGVLRAMGRRYTTRDVPAPPRAARGRVQPDERRDRRLPDRGRARRSRTRCGPSSAPGSRRCTSSRTRRGRAPSTAQADPVAPAEKKERGARLRALSHELERRRWQHEARPRRRRARRPARAAATATTTRRSSSTRPSASSSASAPRPSPRRESMPSPPDDCLFCDIVRQGTYVAKTKASSRSTTSIRRRRRTCSSSPSATSTRSATSASSRPARRSGCSISSPSVAATPA